MRPVSKKRAVAVRIYVKRRAEFLEHNPWCIRCGGTATEVHHKAGRVGVALLDDTRWAAACHDCHVYITAHPAEAIECGWSLPRVGAGQVTQHAYSGVRVVDWSLEDYAPRDDLLPYFGPEDDE